MYKLFRSRIRTKAYGKSRFFLPTAFLSLSYLPLGGTLIRSFLTRIEIFPTTITTTLTLFLDIFLLVNILSIGWKQFSLYEKNGGLKSLKRIIKYPFVKLFYFLYLFGIFVTGCFILPLAIEAFTSSHFTNQPSIPPMSTPTSDLPPPPVEEEKKQEKGKEEEKNEEEKKTLKSVAKIWPIEELWGVETIFTWIVLTLFQLPNFIIYGNTFFNEDELTSLTKFWKAYSFFGTIFAGLITPTTDAFTQIVLVGIGISLFGLTVSISKKRLRYAINTQL
jgi:Sec-independent protein translocase protein (TatC)